MAGVSERTDDATDEHDRSRALLHHRFRDGCGEIECGFQVDVEQAVQRLISQPFYRESRYAFVTPDNGLAELRRDERFANVPIVALTASAMQGDREKALEAGFTEYITKPVNLRFLREEITRLLNP